MTAMLCMTWATFCREATMAYNLKSATVGVLLRADHEDTWSRVSRALEDAGGNVTSACAALDVGWRTFMRWRTQMPRLQSLVAHTRAQAKLAP